MDIRTVCSTKKTVLKEEKKKKEHRVVDDGKRRAAHLAQGEEGQKNEGNGR